MYTVAFVVKLEIISTLVWPVVVGEQICALVKNSVETERIYTRSFRMFLYPKYYIFKFKNVVVTERIYTLVQECC